MKEDSILTNILSIAGSGLLLLLTGLVFLIFRDYISKHIRFFLPIPPVGVAAYIYVYNLYLQNGNRFAGNFSSMAKEVFLSVIAVSISFAVFAVLLIIFINFFRNLFP